MDRLTGRGRAGVALSSGVLAALSLPPLHFWPLLFVAIPLFLMVLERVPLKSWRSGFGAGWLFGLGYFGFAFHWIGFAFLVDASTYLWMMPFMLGALAGGMAVYWGLAAVVARRIGSRGPPLVLALAGALGAAEWLRGHLLTGFPWAAPGLAVDGMGGLAQSASVVGMTGLTVLIVLWSGLVRSLLQAPNRLTVLLSLALFSTLPVCWALGVWRLSSASVAMVPDVAIRIVQPNIEQEQKWRDDNARGIFDQLKELSSKPTATHPDGIASITHEIWPESAVPFLIAESDVAKAELKQLLGGHTVLITGSLRRDADQEGGSDDKIYNSVVTFDGEAKVVGVYDKWRLVPGGEFLPFEWLLEPLGFRKVVTVPGSFAAGPGPVTLRIPGLPPVAMLVCYEAIFPHQLVDPADRPGLIVNVTNDGWFGRSTGPYQHLSQARLRTIEQGLPLLRAANTGISAVIDPYGRITAQLPLQTSGILDSALPTPVPPTVYARWGDTLTALMIFSSLGLAMALRVFARLGQPDGHKPVLSG